MAATATRRDWRHAGPFRDAQPVAGAHGGAIDPAAFVDDDGTPYLFWGQFHARGARLRDDLTAIVPETLNQSLINEADHGFHEGASVRKRDGVYYLVYADIGRGRPTALGYATASTPLGPYTKRGIIVDNAGCDPETWNNHGSIAEVDGRWYVFYHRSSQNSRYNRRLCIEPIEFTADGSIPEVPMTTGGVERPLDARRFMDASRACIVRGGLFAAPVRAPELPDASASPAIASVAIPEPPHEVLTHTTDGGEACYRYYDFREETNFSCLASSATYGGTIEIRLDAADGDLLGSCTVEPTGDWGRFARTDCEIRPVSGVHELWLVFRTGRGRSPGRLVDVLGFWFA